MNIQKINTVQYNKYQNFDKKNIKEETLEPVNNNPSFNGKFGDKIGEFFGRHYVEPVIKKNFLVKTSDKLSAKSSDLTAHMATLGSLITSSVYMERTLSNKDLDSQKRKTLAINQGLCFVIPTILAYFVNSKIGNYVKNKEHKYSGFQAKKNAMNLMTPKQAEEYKKMMGTRLKGFKTLATLATFTVIYRYLTPVAITPLANWMGKKLNNNDAEKDQSNDKIKSKIA